MYPKAKKLVLRKKKFWRKSYCFCETTIVLRKLGTNNYFGETISFARHTYAPQKLVFRGVCMYPEHFDPPSLTSSWRHYSDL